MFQRKEALHPAKHAALKVLETNDYSYARAEIIAPIVFDEIADAAREYPIIFPDNDESLPSVLLGVEAGQNAYVADDGRWLGAYIPAYLRRYPFIFGETGQMSGDKHNYVVMLDPDAPHFTGSGGHSVFTTPGVLSDHMKRRLELLEVWQKNLPITRQLVKVISDADLLVERQIRIRSADGTEKRIQGLRVVDEKKLNALPHEAFAALRDRGVLPMIYAQLLSWANFRQGPLAGKYPDLAAKPQTNNPDFLFENETIDFKNIF